VTTSSRILRTSQATLHSLCRDDWGSRRLRCRWARAGAIEPDPAAARVTRLGDMIQLGPNRVICGNATDPETLRDCRRRRFQELIRIVSRASRPDILVPS
jgi:hypothetical protein